MPAKSKKQQRFMGIVHGLQKGTIDPDTVSGKAKEVAFGKGKRKPITAKAAKDFAETKHKGLPEKVKKENMITKFSDFLNEERDITDYIDREDSYGSMLIDKLEDMRIEACEMTGKECETIEDAISILKTGDVKQKMLARKMTEMYAELGKHKGWISESPEFKK